MQSTDRLYNVVSTGGKLIGEKPEFDNVRSLLRSGPAGSLRTDIRAVSLTIPRIVNSVLFIQLQACNQIIVSTAGSLFMGFQASELNCCCLLGLSSLLMHITARVSSKNLIEFLPIVFLRNGHVFFLL
jgi:hypothetical protein